MAGRAVPQHGQEGCAVRGSGTAACPQPQARGSGSAAGLSWQPSQPCGGVFPAEEQHTLILHCLAMDLPQCCNLQPRKPPCPGRALGELVPAWPGLATCSAERAGRRREARKAWWATEGIVIARKLNCNIVRIQGNYFSSFLTGHGRRCLLEFRSVLQGAGQVWSAESAPHFLSRCFSTAVSKPPPGRRG